MLKSFYEGKTILLTGATGFLGKVVLEKIMRSLPGVKTIYLAISPKVSELFLLKANFLMFFTLGC